MPLEKVKKQLESENKKFSILPNNFNVKGDTILVTNAKEQDEQIILTVGEFIFDLKKEQNDK